MFFKKKQNNFEKNRDQINKFLDKGKFDSAVSKFSDLMKFYNRLKLTKKIEHEEDYRLIRDQLILYMKVKEIDFLISNNEIERLRENLLYVESKTIKLRVGRPLLLKYVSEKYNNYLRVYHAIVYKEEFDDNLHNLYYFLENGEYDSAIKLFPDLLKAFNDIKDNFNVDPNIYETLLKLKKEVEIKLLEKEAYGKVAQVDVETLKNSLKAERYLNN